MADTNTSLRDRIVATLTMAARPFLFLSCLVLFGYQFYELSVRDLKGQYVVVALSLATVASGILCSITNNPKHLKMFAYAIIGLTLFGCLVNYSDYMGIRRHNQEILSVMEGYLSVNPWYSKDNTSIVDTSFWNEFQHKNKCCGIEGRSDWNKFRPKLLAEDVLPSTCCTNATLTNSTGGPCRYEHAFEEGCKLDFAGPGIHFSVPFFAALQKLFYVALAISALHLAGTKFNFRVNSGTTPISTQP